MTSIRPTTPPATAPPIIVPSVDFGAAVGDGVVVAAGKSLVELDVMLLDVSDEVVVTEVVAVGTAAEFVANAP